VSGRERKAVVFDGVPTAPYNQPVSGDLSYYVLLIPAVLLAITFHEFAHARVALAFGDRTAEDAGRVTLNPIAHLDPIGTIGFIIGGFGWGRPVPVNPSQMSHPRADFFVSAAGPASNLVIAVAAAALLRVLLLSDTLLAGSLGVGIVGFLHLLIQINLVLCFFNLLPIFPLDGSHMAENLLPLEQAYTFKRFNEAYGMPILFSLIALGVMTGFSPLHLVLGPPIAFVTSLLVP